jgi:hypothetical protein
MLRRDAVKELGVITDQRLADVTTAHLRNLHPIDSRCCVRAIMLQWFTLL